MLQGSQTELEDAKAFARECWSEGDATTTLVNYTKQGKPFFHHLHSRKMTDPTSGEVFFVTNSFGDDVPHHAFAPISDVGCVLMCVIFLALTALHALSGAPPLAALVFNLSERDFVATQHLFHYGPAPAESCWLW